MLAPLVKPWSIIRRKATGRLSVADDDIQHGGQACYVRGLLERK